MVPASPTVKPVSAFVKKMLVKLFVVPLVCGVQFVPPSVVLRIVPVSPTTIPVSVLVIKTLRKIFVPIVNMSQLVPPSVVVRIVPFRLISPTTIPLFLFCFEKQTPYKLSTGGVCTSQVVPPFVVWRILPACPTAVPVSLFVK